MQREVSHVKRARLLSQDQILTLEDWTHITINNGLDIIPFKGDVACVQQRA